MAKDDHGAATLHDDEHMSTAGGEALELHDVQVTLNGRTLVAVTRTVAPGEVLTVMGPSGAGKSTLLAYIAGFLDTAFVGQGAVRLRPAAAATDRPMGGEADARTAEDVDLTDLPPEQRRVGLLFQDPLLFPHLSVGGNLAFGLPAHVRDRRARGESGLVSVGLEGFYDRDVATLSGGQKARVALLRLLLSEPRAVLLDEPFSKLDSSLRDDIRKLVFDRLRSAGLPSILVTHDEADAVAAGGPLISLSDPASS